MQETHHRHCPEHHRHHSHLWEGAGCAILRDSAKRTSTVTRMMTRTSAIPVTVCSDEKPGLSAVQGRGGGGGEYHGDGGVGGQWRGDTEPHTEHFGSLHSFRASPRTQATPLRRRTGAPFAHRPGNAWDCSKDCSLGARKKGLEFRGYPAPQ